LCTISSAGEGFDKSKIAAKECKEKSGLYIKSCTDEVKMVYSFFTNRKCKGFCDLFYPESEYDKTLSRNYILGSLDKFRIDALNEGYKHIIIYYTGHGYEGGNSNGHWVCRNDQGVSLKDVSDIFKDFLQHDSKTVTIISDCCRSGQWIDDVSLLEFEPKNLTIISASLEGENAKPLVLSKALANQKIPDYST